MKKISIIGMVLMLIASIPWTVSAQQIWGVTKNGGANGTGTIFKTDASGGNHVTHLSFNVIQQNGMDAGGDLMLASDGMLYGVTLRGGNENSGVLYQVNPSTNAFVKIFDFFRAPGLTGRPSGKLVQIGTKLYGMTAASGANALGSIYEYNMSTGAVASIYSFTGVLNGGYPNTLPVVVNNKIYGTSLGGVSSAGIIWEYDPATSTYTKKLDFNTYGAMQPTPMAVGPSSKIYFTAWTGGSRVLYEYTPGGTTLTAKYTFTTPVTGFSGQMVITSTGKIYAIATLFGGSGGIAEYDLNTSTLTLKRTFGSAAAEGTGPQGLWLGSSNDMLYGTTDGGGASGKGIVYEYQISTNTFWKRLDGGDFSYPQPGLCWNAATGNFLARPSTRTYPVTRAACFAIT